MDAGCNDADYLKPRCKILETKMKNSEYLKPICKMQNT